MRDHRHDPVLPQPRAHARQVGGPGRVRHLEQHQAGVATETEPRPHTGIEPRQPVERELARRPAPRSRSPPPRQPPAGARAPAPSSPARSGSRPARAASRTPREPRSPPSLGPSRARRRGRRRRRRARAGRGCEGRSLADRTASPQRRHPPKSRWRPAVAGLHRAAGSLGWISSRAFPRCAPPS